MTIIFICLMQHHMNGAVIDEVPKFLASIPIETIHAIQVSNSFKATHPIIIPLQITEETSTSL